MPICCERGVFFGLLLLVVHIVAYLVSVLKKLASYVLLEMFITG